MARGLMGRESRGIWPLYTAFERNLTSELLQFFWIDSHMQLGDSSSEVEVSTG